jgi:glutamate--cysteine ligase catalytic subunit
MTFQACNINEARHLYDQLAVLTPIMVSFHNINYNCLETIRLVIDGQSDITEMPFQVSHDVNKLFLCSSQHALSAGAPIFRGYLADVDCRWNVIAAAVDDRTEEERGLVVSSLERCGSCDKLLKRLNRS